MKKFSALVLGLSMVLTPLSSLAAFTMPSELLAAIQSGKAMTFSGEMHGHAGNYYMALWINGTSTLSQANPMGATKATIDISAPQGKLRAKVQIRVKEKKMYVFIDSIEGSLDNVVTHFAGSMKSKQWFSIPMDEIASSEMQAQDMSSMDEFLQLMSAPAKNGGTIYTLTLTRDAAREVVQGLSDMNLRDLGIEITNAMPPKVTFQVQMTVDAKNSLQLTTMNMDLSQTGFGISLKGWSAPAKSGFTVEVPKNVVSADEWANAMGNLWTPDFGIPPSTHDEWEDTSSSKDSTWTDTGSTDSWMDSSSSNWGSSSDDCLMDISAVRHGGCDIQKPTHR